MTARSIGRHPDCDVVIKDPTVSRRHVECSEIGAGLFMVVDQGSTSGSFRREQGAWLRFTSAKLRGDDPIRLGAFETTVGALMRQERASRQPSSPPRVERDPLTGQIVVRPR